MLSHKQLLFCRHFLTTAGEAEEAAKLAGYADPKFSSAKLLAIDEVRRKINQLEEDALKRAEVSLDSVIAETARLAFSNIFDVVDEVVVGYTDEGIPIKATNLKNVSSMSRDAMASVSSVRSTKYGVDVKMHGKREALLALLKHLGGLTEKIEISIAPECSKLITERLKSVYGGDDEI